ncbi:hypothetical protein CSUI_008460 [Cystoisospora suis]|uniref:Uncharacterized protein n=1 Tax=Cystoisospora suis TaxID=483139 RepID=A0A2C6KKQ7_9APIC|nr:hypothetical protein CSUI_008460 [Cystoisospora suis]
MPGEEEERCGTGEGAGGSECLPAAAASPPPPLPVLSSEVLNSLEQQLNQNLHMLFFDTSPKTKASANAWLLQFQQSPEAWQVSRHVLERQLLRASDGISDSGTSSADGGGGEQLVMVAAQTLAWKIIQQSHSLKAEEKKQLACFLLQLVASVHSQPPGQKQLSLSRLSVAVLSRLAECIAQCIVQTGGEQAVWPSALPDLLSFARVPPGSDGSSNSVNASSHTSCLFSLPCCLAVAVLTAIPEVLKGLDAPSRGVRRVVETRQALAVERHWEPVVDLVSDLLLARSRGTRNGRPVHTSASSVTASDSEVSVCTPAGDGNTACECLRFQSLCVEGSLHLLIGWMGLWDTRPFLQHVRLCQALAAAVPQLAEHPALTDCLVAALPKLSTYMQLWSLSGPPAHQQHPRSSSCSSRSRPLGDSPLPPGTSTAEFSGVCGGSGVCGPDASQQQLLRAWSEGGLPSTGGEGELCGAVVRQLIEVSRVLSSRDVSKDLRVEEDSGEMLALLLRWGAVLQTLLEGFPGLLLDDFGIDRGGALLTGGGSFFENQSVCGTLLVQLWDRQPQTWLCASNIWGVVKELRRDQLLPVPLLRVLLQRLAPACISSMLRHCRRDSFAWGLGTDSSSPSSSVAELVEERELYIDTAGDVVCDVFFLYDACGGEEGREFLQSLGEGMQAALRQRDAAGAEVLLLLSDALVEGLNGIPLPLAPLFLCLPALPEDDAACATAAAKILKKAAIHFTEEDPEYAGLSAPPTATCSAALLTQIWTVALQTLLRLLPLDPSLVADSVLQLATWGGHHLGATDAEGTAGGVTDASGTMAGGGDTQQSSATGREGEQQLPSSSSSGSVNNLAAALQQLELFCKFVEETGSNYSAQVDGTLHAAAVKLVLTFPRSEIPRLFNGSMRGTRLLLRRCCEELGTKITSSGTHTEVQGITSAAWRGDAARAIQRLELCCSALCGGRVCTSRSSGGCMASSCTAVGTNGGGDEDDSRLASAALECFFLEDDLWLLWLRVLRGVLLLQHHSLASSCDNGMTCPPPNLTLPVNAVTGQRVHLGALVVDLKGKEPLEPPQSNDAVLCVSGLRCMRLFLRGLGPDFLAATQVWAAVADFVGNELVASARRLAEQAAASVAAGGGVGKSV